MCVYMCVCVCVCVCVRVCWSVLPPFVSAAPYVFLPCCLLLHTTLYHTPNHQATLVNLVQYTHTHIHTHTHTSLPRQRRHGGGAAVGPERGAGPHRLLPGGHEGSAAGVHTDQTRARARLPRWVMKNKQINNNNDSGNI
jgi:hypothetical protein